jgi:hypothetical protein
MNLAAFWQQVLPTMPVLPNHKYCGVNNLSFDPYIMEGIRLEMAVFCSFVPRIYCDDPRLIQMLAEICFRLRQTFLKEFRRVIA